MDDKHCMVHGHHLGTLGVLEQPFSILHSLSSPCSLSLSPSFPQTGVEKEHKTFLFHHATAFKLRLCVCMVFMIRGLQMFSTLRVFLLVCDHLQHSHHVMLPVLQLQLTVNSNAALHQSCDQARAWNESGRA